MGVLGWILLIVFTVFCVFLIYKIYVNYEEKDTSVESVKDMKTNIKPKDNEYVVDGFDYSKNIKDINTGINTTSEILFEKLNENNKYFWIYWMSIVPYNLFNQLFISDTSIKVPVFKDADNNALYDPIYITQAFVLFYLENIINNDKNYSSKFNIKSSDIEIICNTIYSQQNNPVLHNLKYFKEILNKLDPRDRIIEYIYTIGELYIHEKHSKTSMSNWDANYIAKIELIGWFTNFIVSSKEKCLDDSYMTYFRKNN